MHTKQCAIALAALLPHAIAHGMITSITGANGVTMPGLSVIDGTPRDCPTPGCGAEADTSIFHGGNPLGHVVGGNDVNAETNVAMFMSGTPSSAAAASSSASSSDNNALGGLASLLGGLRKRDTGSPLLNVVGDAADMLTGGDENIGDILTGENNGIEGDVLSTAVGGVISGLQAGAGVLGLGKRDSGNPLLNAAGDAAGALTGGDENIGDIITGENNGVEGQALSTAVGGVISGLQAASNLAGLGRRQSGDAPGTPSAQGAVENMVASTAGQGAKSGLPTMDDNGIVSVNFHQVNQDGAGPYAASVDSTSGGTEESAFKPATIMDNIGGIASLSLVTATDFPVRIQVPQGTVCSATVAGVKNVCIVRMINSAIAGPFGGSAAFTQSPAAQKRALEYQRIKRSRIARDLQN